MPLFLLLIQQKNTFLSSFEVDMLCSFWLQGNKKWNFFIFVFAEIALLENEVNRSFHAENLSLTFHLVFCTVLQIQYGKSRYTAAVHLDVGLITFVSLRSKTASYFAISFDNRCILQCLMTSVFLCLISGICMKPISFSFFINSLYFCKSGLFSQLASKLFWKTFCLQTGHSFTFQMGKNSSSFLTKYYMLLLLLNVYGKEAQVLTRCCPTFPPFVRPISFLIASI